MLASAAKLPGFLVPIEAVLDLVREEYTLCRIKLENLPNTLTGRTARMTNSTEIKGLAESLVSEAVGSLVGDLSRFLAADRPSVRYATGGG